MFWVVIIILIIGGMSNAIMDVLRFRYSTSIFKNFKNQQWWNPILSSANKWKNGDKSQGERFWGSSRWFVRFTDAWHFFQGMMFTCFFLSIILYQPFINWWADFIIMYFIFTFTFQMFYSKIFIKK